MPRRSRSDAAPFCETLESRLALSAVVNPQGVLVIVGSPTADVVEITAGPAGSAGNGVVTVSGVPGVPNGTQFTGVRGISVDLKSGNDTFALQGDIRNPQGQPAALSVLLGNGVDTANLDSLAGAGTIKVNGGNGNDTLFGSGLADLLKGGKGNDNIFGRAGNDRLDGQKGNDLLVGDEGEDSVFGGDGTDTCYGNAGIDLIRGGKGPDLVIGGLATDSLFGEGGQDTFFGFFAEQQDFNPQDANWSNAFTSSATHAMLSEVFWQRLADSESAGIMAASIIAVTRSLLAANAATAAQQNAFFNAFTGLNSGQISAFGGQMVHLTDSFSPPIAANPALYTSSRLTSLFGGMQSIAPTTPSTVRPTFSAMNSAIVTALTNVNFFADARALPSGPRTTAFFYSMDDFLNRGIDVRF